MFCEKCGKEISNQANFCNFCGAKVTPARTQPAAGVNSSVKPQSKPAASAANASGSNQKKEGTAGKFIITVIIAVCVYFGVRFLTEQWLSKDNSSSANNSSARVEHKDGGFILNSSTVADSCMYGGMYKDNYLTYGNARIRLLNYTLHDGTNGESDYLLSPTKTISVNVERENHLNFTFERCTADTILNSSKYREVSDAKVIEFKKFTAQGHRIVTIIISCTHDGTRQYIGEMLIFPSEKTIQTVNFIVQTLPSNGYGVITDIFDTLSISSSYALTYEDTGIFGENQIVVR